MRPDLRSRRSLWVGLFTLAMMGCASQDGVRSRSFDASAKERARPYLAGVDLHEEKNGASCPTRVNPPANGDDLAWRDAVKQASACVAAKKWDSVKTLGQWLLDWHIDAPWGAYFLAVAEFERGEKLRANWLLELAEKKAGGPLAIVHFERARWLELETPEGQSRRPALVEMQAALKLDPNLVAGWFWMAQLHDRELMEKEAVELYEKVLSLDPGHKGAKSALNRIASLKQAKSEGGNGGSS